MRYSTVGEVVDAVRRGLLDRDSAVEYLRHFGFTEPGRILDDLAPVDGPVDFDDGPPVDYDDDRLSAVANLAKAAELVADLVRKDNTGQGCAPGGRIGANDTLPLQSLLGLSLTHLHGADEITAAVDDSQPRRVPDLPCPKCGWEDTVMHWHKAGHELSLTHRRCVTYDRPSEHFHRECRRCLADWVTTDMLDAEDAR